MVAVKKAGCTYGRYRDASCNPASISLVLSVDDPNPFPLPPLLLLPPRRWASAARRFMW